jgi:hypothetical protein
VDNFAKTQQSENMNASDRMAKARAARGSAKPVRKPRKSVNLSDRQRERLAGIPADYRRVTESAYLGGSRTDAVKAKCLDCSNWTRKEITLCQVDTCPLWPYRPYQDATP